MIDLRMLRLLPVLLGLASCAAPDGKTSASSDFGTAVQSTFTTSTDFAGNPIAEDASVRPPSPGDICEAMAQNRAREIATEGYDETLQRHVHDAVLADCRTWSKRR